MKNKRLRNALIIIGALFLVLVAVFFIYVGSYYSASSEVDDYYYLEGSVRIKKIDDGLFFDGEGKENALIFYPGAKVEYTSYIPLMYEIAEKGVDVFLLKMPFNLAFFAIDKAEEIIEYYDYDSFYISGHSMGGVAASCFAYDEGDRIEGIIFLASFSDKDLTSSGLRALSIYGTEDGILNKESYEKAKSLLPSDSREVIIDGGNHSYYGLYGEQKGDGKATITPLEQREKTVDAIISFILGFE